MNCDMIDCKQAMEPEFVWVPWYDGWQVGIVCNAAAAVARRGRGRTNALKDELQAESRISPPVDIITVI